MSSLDTNIQSSSDEIQNKSDNFENKSNSDSVVDLQINKNNQENIPNDRLSKSWEMISKKESQIREQNKLIKEKMIELENREKELNNSLLLAKKAKESPFEYMEEVNGKDWYQKATNRFLNEDNPKTLSIEDTIIELKNTISNMENNFKEQLKKQLDEELSKKEKQYTEQNNFRIRAEAYMTELNDLIEKDERFGLVRKLDPNRELITGLINDYGQKYHDKDGNPIWINAEEAAILCEQELEERFIKPLRGLPKISKLLEPQKDVVNGSAKESKPETKTLTNQLSITGTPVDISPYERDYSNYGLTKMWERSLLKKK